MLPIKKDAYYTVHGTRQNFDIHIKPIHPTSLPNIKNYAQETLKAVEEIYNHPSRTAPLNVLYSGGIDSELILRCLHKLKIPHKTTIIKLNNQYNKLDLLYADLYCNKYKITPKVIEFDITAYLRDPYKMMELAVKSRSPAYKMFYPLEVALTLDGMILTGWDHPYYGKDKTTNKWYFEDKERWQPWTNMFKQGYLDGTHAVLSWTAEQFFSFGNHHVIKQLCNNEMPGKIGVMTSRLPLYNELYDINTEHTELMLQRPKLTRWERIDMDPAIRYDKVIQDNINRVQKLEALYSGEYMIEYNELMGKLVDGNMVANT